MIHGLDISNYQGNPNYDQLKIGASFVIIKTSEGTGFKDPTAARNQEEARRVGIGLGYYHFARPDLGNSPVAEADWFLGCIGDIQEGEVLTLDYEVSYQDPVNWCKAFLDHLFSKTNGNKPLIYLNQSLIQGYNWQAVIDAGYGLWVASYDNDPSDVHFDTKWPVVAMKQYTSSASFPGVSGNIDADVFYGDLNTFKAYGYKPDVTLPPPSSLPIPTLDDDHLRAVKNLDFYRNDPSQNRDGSESNFEGFCARLMDRDRKWDQLNVDLTNTQKDNKTQADKAIDLTAKLNDANISLLKAQQDLKACQESSTGGLTLIGSFFKFVLFKKQ